LITLDGFIVDNLMPSWLHYKNIHMSWWHVYSFVFND